MLSAVATASFVGMSDTMRPNALIGFVVLMFGVAGIAVFFGQRRHSRGQADAIKRTRVSARALSKGGDATLDEDWARGVRDDPDGAPRHSWADAILGVATAEVGGSPATQGLHLGSAQG